jgi:hypothetical protein
METQQCIQLSIAVELITFCNVCTSSTIPGLKTFYSKSDFTVTLSRRKQSNVHRCSNTGPRYICMIFNKSVHSLDRFSYVSNSKFHENPCSGSWAKYLRADEWKHGRTDMTKLYSNIYPTRCNATQFILSGNCSTCFGWYHHLSSGAQTTVSTASGICHTVTATCRYSGR